jgi:hypothetical protein
MGNWEIKHKEKGDMADIDCSGEAIWLLVKVKLETAVEEGGGSTWQINDQLRRRMEEAAANENVWKKSRKMDWNNLLEYLLGDHPLNPFK